MEIDIAAIIETSFAVIFDFSRI